MKISALIVAATVGLFTQSAFAGEGVPLLKLLSGQVSMQVDDARAFAAPKEFDTFVLSNPMVAEVTLSDDRRSAIVTGRSFGMTSVIFLAANGTQLVSAQISVKPAAGTVSVRHGDKRATYFCDPICVPTHAVGDAPERTAPISGQIQERLSTAGSSR